MRPEVKKIEIEKLNKAQRSKMRQIWGQPIDVIHVDEMGAGYRHIKVRNKDLLWLCVELGPRGAVHSKRYHDYKKID